MTWTELGAAVGVFTGIVGMITAIRARADQRRALESAKADRLEATQQAAVVIELKRKLARLARRQVKLQEDVLSEKRKITGIAETQVDLQRTQVELQKLVAAGPQAASDRARAADIVIQARLAQLRIADEITRSFTERSGPARPERAGRERRPLLEAPVTIDVVTTEGVVYQLQQHEHVIRVVHEPESLKITLTTLERMVYFPPPPPGEDDVRERGAERCWAAAISSSVPGDPWGQLALEEQDGGASCSRNEWFATADQQLAETEPAPKVAAERVARGANHLMYLNFLSGVPKRI